MTDLPCCKLCKCAPMDSQTVAVMVTCSKSNCPCGEAWFTEKQWRKLMYVPAKMPVPEYDYSGPVLQNEGDISHAEGWNDCIEAIQKVGDL